MPTTGALVKDPQKYGSTYSNEAAKAGYYSTNLNKYDETTLRDPPCSFVNPKPKFIRIFDFPFGKK